jgi:hypothetical protein
VIVIGAGALLFLAPEARWWSEHQDLRLFSAAQAVNVKLDEYRKSAENFQGEAGNSADFRREYLQPLRREFDRAGRPIASLSMDFPKEGPQPVKLLVGSDAQGREVVVFYKDGKVGIEKAALKGKRENWPSWVKALD